MSSYKVLSLNCLLMAMAAASPLPFADNTVFADFLRNAQLTAPSKESVVVKRRIFEDNADGQLKQISLRSLIGDLEKNMFASALSVNKVFTDKDVTVPEIKGSDDLEHDINQSQSLANEETKSDLKTTTSTTTTTAESSATLPVTDKVIMQTQPSGAPTHIVIDRIAIQPHTGGIALIPIFELKRTTNDANVNKDHEITKITISKTEITSLATAAPDSSTSSSTTDSTTSTASTSKPTETVLETATTPKNIEQLKEAEEDLKEKVAEIEAEPIILSARV